MAGADGNAFHAKWAELNATLSSAFGSVDGWTYDAAIDCLMTHACYGFDLPVDDETARQAVIAGAEQHAVLINYENYGSLSVGPLIQEIRAQMEAVKTGAPAPGARAPAKLALFSGHDTTVMPFLLVVGGKQFVGSWPSYAALVAMELYSGLSLPGGETWGVRSIYNGSVFVPGGCPEQEVCPWSVYVDAMKKHDAPASDCAASPPPPSTTSAMVPRWEAVVGGVSAGLVMFVVGLLVNRSWLCGRSRSRSGGRDSALRLLDADGSSPLVYTASASRQSMPGIDLGVSRPATPVGDP